MIAFLGMGLLGSNFTRALLAKGNQVNVWNRTAARATALAADGAKPFENAADAVTGAEYVHIVVKDDAAVDAVLEQARAGFKPGTIIIDHTTTSTEGAIQRTKYWAEQGFAYLHAPVFMGPQNALESTGFMLVSGDQRLIQAVEVHLATMTGKLLNFGTEPGKAASMKLIGNNFLVAFTAGIADTLSLSRSLDVPFDDVISLFENWNPAGMVKGRIQRMASGSYSQPSWELNMARKDTGLFIKATEAAGMPQIIIPTIAKEMDKWIEKGHGADDWTIIGHDSIVNPKKK
ncbi:3-hydroxyisobutyrate dehydrogenase [Chitinophaga skermanii]|uniref:3-hydroxyisobutyrate dehydrogenase n=1 Tax=Chitinophaga skermanii TaxID=331697 RepID=A0A327QEQ6_9BACT|nr:NAD(P)-dependent oxidoreductase [Chitinophaga skermanii]RAJ02358.1 3-hydroxyisobutyrate dehydrogenase [Chitinophaga skermanii]